MVRTRLTYFIATGLTIIATMAVSSASFLFVYQGEVPAELFAVKK